MAQMARAWGRAQKLFGDSRGVKRTSGKRQRDAVSCCGTNDSLSWVDCSERVCVSRVGPARREGRAEHDYVGGVKNRLIDS